MDIKAQITMELRGNILLSEEEAEESKSFDSFQMEVKDHLGKETIVVRTRQCKPALKTIHITKEAYEYYTSIEALPKNANVRNWKNMSKTGRFKYAVASLVKELGGSKYTVKVFEE